MERSRKENAFAHCPLKMASKGPKKIRAGFTERPDGESFVIFGRIFKIYLELLVYRLYLI